MSDVAARGATTGPFAGLLDSTAFGVAMRVVLTFPYWGSGIGKLVDFGGAQGEMAHFGLNPPAAYAIATIITQLLGSALVIQGRHAWLGAGALAVFTLLTIPIAHAFWRMPGEEGLHEFYVAVEHVAMCGGLALAAIQARWARLRV